MKILVIGARGIPGVEGGAEKNAERVFPLIADQGCEVRLISLRGLGATGEHKGVKIVPMPNISFFGTDKLVSYAFAFLYAWWYQPQLVHLQGLGAALPLSLYRLSGFKVVARYGSYDYELEKWGPVSSCFWRFCEWQLRWAHAVVAVTDALRGRLAGKGISENVQVIPNARDDDIRRSAGDDTSPSDNAAVRVLMDEHGLQTSRFFLAVGRVTHQKNFVPLAEAFQAYRQSSGEPVKLAIAGGFDDADYVAKLRAAISPDVVLLGRVSRDVIYGLHHQCIGYVSASVAEGNSNAILEAISCETPLALSDIPPNRDLELTERHYFDHRSHEAMATLFADLGRNPDSFRPNPKTMSIWRWEDVARATLNLYRATTTRRSVKNPITVPADD